MGLFGDIRKLKQQADQINADWDPAAQMRAGTAQLQHVQHSMEAQTADLELLRTGLPAAATVIGLADTGTRINLQPLVRISLLVEVAGRPPYPVTREVLLPIHASAQAGVGQRVSVLVHPHQPDRVLVRWGVPG
ncbi:hypothetical protein GCM10010399_67540 [Dactylosporangium fulvum]|uniref:Transcription elongation factor GreA/GreB C-terminal domain-containing protein n=1 Tax=Dactylosporangium fulvum TaxID=53359 RepID=A0ABY5VNT0_9ACTN|nr:hypothetical protein [Dactylosporangium fulvum]UWP78792.1 hypothetical protein Dfulv_26860 [Dactylosporangium fulvum]